MKLTAPLSARLPEATAESVRRNHEQRIAELANAVRDIAESPVAAPAAAVAAPYFDTVIIMTGTPVSFGTAYDQWNVGTLGQRTLIKYITDGTPSGTSTRTVRGLAGGADGKVVTFMNMAPAGLAGVIQFAYESAAGGTMKFHNTGGATVSGGAGGCVTYYYDGPSSMWRQIGTT